jgi:opacity protein-like surface antigen
VLSGLVLGLPGILLGVSQSSAAETAPAADPDRRLYVTGIVGSSLGGDAGPAGKGWIGDLATPTIGGDAAIGVSIDRSQTFFKGTGRLEFEGRTRSRSGGSDGVGGESPATDGSSTSWSTMANVWRDVPITDHLGVYAGGGVGAVGVHGSTGKSGSDLAWQVGGGVTYALNDRLTLDVGYRALPAAFDVGRADAPTGELLFSVRLYEPFRGWLRD